MPYLTAFGKSINCDTLMKDAQYLGEGCSRKCYKVKYKDVVYALKVATRHAGRRGNVFENYFYNNLPNDLQQFLPQAHGVSECGRYFLVEYIAKVNTESVAVMTKWNQYQQKTEEQKTKYNAYCVGYKPYRHPGPIIAELNKSGKLYPQDCHRANLGSRTGAVSAQIVYIDLAYGAKQMRQVANRVLGKPITESLMRIVRAVA